MTRTLLTSLALTLTLAPAAFAATPETLPVASTPIEIGAPPMWGSWMTLTPAPIATPVVVARPVKAKRPALLLALYLSEGALQAFDIHSTHAALHGSAVEANPMMQGLVSNTGAFVAVKASVAAGTIGAAEYLWRHNHRGSAIAMMILSNGLMGFVAQHNASVLGKLK